MIQGHVPLDTDSVVLVLNGQEQQKITCTTRWLQHIQTLIYRQFPVVMANSQMVNSTRPFLCNFLGTVYKNSSRETLMGILKKTGLDKECIITARENPSSSSPASGGFLRRQQRV